MAAREQMNNAPDSWALVAWMIPWRPVSINLMLFSSARPSRIPRTTSTPTLRELEAPVAWRWPSASTQCPTV